ncbi:ABC transporter substrate-binding protein [Deinococcus radiophilus]|uniref:SgrR family transcriptional regulator n=1 Tax=Deinococcus radiophilus TaxID=32062 RepID=A0A3S0IEF6_9DEIO|nr:ABC transporter substrate-binding protein [Deinococcus radiophilus]RTR30696.1 SgrR family transcriptional regulator [Deinococcus radiophilus]UFA51248.1 ABC transporter substrate-binding protein [Deinococcus radiophilus]
MPALSPFKSLPSSPTPDWPWLTLRAVLVAEQGDQRCGRIRVPEVAALWGCSPKTARRILQRWQAAGRCHYVPGQGRGQWSQLTFMGQAEPEIRALAAALVQAGRLDEWSRLNTLGFPVSWTRPPEVGQLFGLHTSPAGQDRLRLLITRPLTSLDPLRSWVTLESWLLHQVFDGLTAQDVGSPLRPALAHHWEVSTDGLTWRFHLRKGVRFHHGRRLTAEDAAFTLRRVTAEAAWSLPGLADVTALDDWTLQLKLCRPDPLLPHRLAQTPLLIQPADAPAQGMELCGTGPFCFSAFAGGLRLRAFDGHYAGRPLLDEAEFFYAPPGTAGGVVELQGAEAIPPQTRTEVERGVQFLIWNARRPAAHDPALRLALAELHDVQTFWQETGRTAQPLATSFFPEFSAQRPARERSLERARRQLEDALLPVPPLTLYVLPYPEARAEAEWLVARAAALGLQISVEVFGLDDERQLDQHADLVLMGEVAGADTALSFWTAMHSPQLLFRRLLPATLLAEVEAALSGLGQDEQSQRAAITAAEGMLQVSGWVNLTHHRVKQASLSAGLRGAAPDIYGRVGLRGLWVNRWPLEN